MTTTKKPVAQSPTQPALEPHDGAEQIVESVEGATVTSGTHLIKPAKSWRIRERKDVLLGALELLREAGIEPGGEGQFEIDQETLGTEQMLELLAQIDEFLEEIAIDRAAYALWATEEGGGPDLNGRVLDLFGWVVRRLGE